MILGRPAKRSRTHPQEALAPRQGNKHAHRGAPIHARKGQRDITAAQTLAAVGYPPATYCVISYFAGLAGETPSLAWKSKVCSSKWSVRTSGCPPTLGADRPLIQTWEA